MSAFTESVVEEAALAWLACVVFAFKRGSRSWKSAAT